MVLTQEVGTEVALVVVQVSAQVSVPAVAATNTEVASEVIDLRSVPGTAQVMVPSTGDQ